MRPISSQLYAIPQPLVHFGTILLKFQVFFVRKFHSNVDTVDVDVDVLVQFIGFVICQNYHFIVNCRDSNMKPTIENGVWYDSNQFMNAYYSSTTYR